MLGFGRGRGDQGMGVTRGTGARLLTCSWQVESGGELPMKNEGLLQERLGISEKSHFYKEDQTWRRAGNYGYDGL